MLGKFASKVADVLGGSFVKEVKDGIMAYFPPDMSPQEKAVHAERVEAFLHQKFMDKNKLLTEAADQLDRRIEQQEGSAKDLKSIPILGHLIIFLRAAQRPIWGYATLYIDGNWFLHRPVYTEQQQAALIVVNVLVLGFLFGERTIKNLEPLIMSVFGKKSGVAAD